MSYVIAEVEAAADRSPEDRELGTLASTLHYARARLGDMLGNSDDWPEHVRCAQAVLEIAVEWRMPRMERWAVAWLAASGREHLRLRWSSRFRDGRARRDGRASGAVTAMVGGRTHVVIGTDGGHLETWSPESGSQVLGRLEKQYPVLTVAHRDTRYFAGGPFASFVALGWDPGPARNDQLLGIRSSAIAPDGMLACGNESGAVFAWVEQGHWTLVDDQDDHPVIALHATRSWLSAIWSDGRSTTWRRRGPLGLQFADPRTISYRGTISAANWGVEGITAASWSENGKLAAVIAGRIHRLGAEGSHDREQLDAYSVAWSAGGHLASGGGRTIVVGENRIFSSTGLRHVAFVGDKGEQIVSAAGRSLEQWDLTLVGAEDPTSEMPGRISAIGLASWDRSRTAAGTSVGGLVEYDGEGLIVSQTLLPSRGHIHRLVPWSPPFEKSPGWLIAAHTGAWLWLPEQDPANDPVRPIGAGRHLCLSVAAHESTIAYGRNNEVRTSDGTPALAFATAVRDIRFGPRNRLAAVDDDGVLTVREPGDAGIWRMGPLGRQIDILDVRDREIVVHRRGDGAILEVTGDYVREQSDGPPPGCKASGYGPLGVAFASPTAGGLVQRPRGRRPLHAPTRAEVVATGTRTVVVAAGQHIMGYDVIGSSVRSAGVVTLLARAMDDGVGIYIKPVSSDRDRPPSTLVRIDGERIMALAKPATTVTELSYAIAAGAEIGDKLWEQGLAAEIDQARGADPSAPVRLEWQGPGDDVPWELLHPFAAPLGWFDDPPTTMIRRIQSPAVDRSAPPKRPTMLAIRGDLKELAGVDQAYERLRRRTRTRNVRIVGSAPARIAMQADLERASARCPDVLQLWAHCGPTHVRFSETFTLTIDKAVEALTKHAPRLVVLVGCRSGAFARALIACGVSAVVAMRVEVMNHTVAPLVEDLTAEVLAGTAVDLAFAEALRSYLLTGQPGAAAIPVLHLALDVEPTLFA